MVKVIFLLVLLLLIPMIPATDYVQKNTGTIISKSVVVDGVPQSSLIVNITVVSPNGNILIGFKPMTYDPAARKYFFNLSAGNTTEKGTYTYTISATNSIFNETKQYFFIVNNNGQEFNTQQGIIYFALLALLCVFVSFSVYGAIVIPADNDRNEFDEIIKINKKKYAKYGLIIASWIFFLWIFYICYNLSYAVLDLDSVYKIFYMLYKVMYAITIPLVAFIFVMGIIVRIKDGQVEKLLEQGVSSIS